VSLYSPPSLSRKAGLVPLHGASLEPQRTQRIINFPLPLTPLDAGQGRRQWKSTKQLTLRKRQNASILWSQGANVGILLPEGLSHFAFRRLSEKQKKLKTLRFLRLRGE